MAVDATDRPTVAEQVLDPSLQPSYRFSFNDFLKREYRFGLDPNRPVCKAYMQGHCPLGNACPDKHNVPSHSFNMVCKHWLRGLCKKGDACDYLHEYNLRRMPECSHYARHQTCPNGPDCLYAHVDPDFKRPACPWYERGFCPLGPYCADKHVKKDAICRFYVAGFCPDGKECKEGEHPKYQPDLKEPKVRVYKPPEQLEQERIEREMEAEREAEREREREDRGFNMGGGQQRFGKGRWNRKRKSGRRGQY